MHRKNDLSLTKFQYLGLINLLKTVFRKFISFTSDGCAQAAEDSIISKLGILSSTLIFAWRNAPTEQQTQSRLLSMIKEQGRKVTHGQASNAATSKKEFFKQTFDHLFIAITTVIYTRIIDAVLLSTWKRSKKLPRLRLVSVSLR